jgi:hypothetical protein
MSTISDKSDRLAMAHRKLDSFIATGGDLKAPAAAEIQREFEEAFKDLDSEFGPPPESPYNKRGLVLLDS